MQNLNQKFKRSPGKKTKKASKRFEEEKGALLQKEEKERPNLYKEKLNEGGIKKANAWLRETFLEKWTHLGKEAANNWLFNILVQGKKDFLAERFEHKKSKEKAVKMAKEWTSLIYQEIYKVIKAKFGKEEADEWQWRSELIQQGAKKHEQAIEQPPKQLEGQKEKRKIEPLSKKEQPLLKKQKKDVSTSVSPRPIQQPKSLVFSTQASDIAEPEKKKSGKRKSGKKQRP